MYDCTYIRISIVLSFGVPWCINTGRSAFLLSLVLLGHHIHQSTVIQDNSIGVLFNGLLAELPTILDSFITSTTSDYIGVVG